jgi:cardiolipin synthase
MPAAPSVVSVPGNRVVLLHDGEQCLAAMRDLVASAEREILLEMYWFESDQTGRGFAQALAERARSGVRVCVTYDAFGSFEADRSMFDQMRTAGCGVYEYNPVRLWRPRFGLTGWQRRNHRKMLVVDGRVGMTGGVNLTNAWAPVSEGGHGYRDDMVRIEGPAVSSMREVFLRTYLGAYGAEARRDRSLPPDASGTSTVAVISNHRRSFRRAIEDTYLERIRRAREHIYITNSYFLPRRAVRRALADAVRRGVRVRVLVPGDSDVPAVTHATRYLYDWLLEQGIEMHEWSGSVLHSKTAVVDDDWCTVGTYNFDHRSWEWNLELNVAIEDANVARDLASHMQRDYAHARRVRLDDRTFRPLGDRMLETLFYRMRRLL